jgi:pimeloyl-ACP methyl ester carboxylesterase
MKENLVLVHSFPTNSTLLKGLIEYLEEHFNLYFIDLPGFKKGVPSTKGKVTFEYFSDYVAEQVDKFNLGDFIIGGISFGFLVANNAPIDLKKCKAIIAIEPYLNRKYLHLKFIKRFVYTHVIDEILEHNLTDEFWNSGYAAKILSFITERSTDKTEVVVKEIDDKVFFQTAKLIMENEKELQFRNIPYVLVINRHDEGIAVDAIVEEFRENTKPLLIKYTDLEHYPEDVSRTYFEQKLPSKEINEIKNWINKESKK